jgi:hypothetical protein
MSSGEVYAAGWSLDDIDWSRFDAARVDPELLGVVKAAALVEFNAHDYVAYLKRVYRGSSPETMTTIERWGEEEVQHGTALGRWCELADPSFNFRESFTRFRAGYRPPHFVTGDGSVRGSRRGEMIARCVVESGTSSFYSAIRDAADEPVLKEIAGRIAADEFRHYRLFLDMLTKEGEPDLPLWRKLWVAATRMNESDDDELAFAYYCGNVPAAREKAEPYRREPYSKVHHAACFTLYRRHHIDKLVKMVMKPAGLNPQGRVSSFASAALWRVMAFRAGGRADQRKAA